ncbi:MAG TPA: DMT family transporter [Gemmataceae bacterium]|nr:DMT family transporter [Gemmataceae bacterium]
MSVAAPSVAQARLCLVLAAVLWSSGSLFMRLAQQPALLGWSEPGLAPLPIAFFRALFAGVVMIPLIRPDDVRFRLRMGLMVVTFALMSGVYLSAMGLGKAGNAIFLQNTAPFWVYVFGVVLLGTASDRRGWAAVSLGLLGAVVIVGGNWPADLPPSEQQAAIGVLCLGVASGVVYAGVVLFLSSLREFSPAWLVFLNHIGSAAALGLFIALAPADVSGWVAMPTSAQLALLAVFGAVQMAIPYWLFARGLRVVSPQEAGIITLLEPLLNPVWAYLITPETDTPNGPMFLGGGLILAALVWRYMPQPRRRDAERSSPG